MALKKVEKRRKWISFAILLVVCIIFMIPLIWAVATSFKSSSDITHHITSLIPYHPIIDNYKTLFTDPDIPIFKWLRNSAIVSITHTILYLIVASLAGYAFGVLEWKGRDKVFWFLLLTMMIPNVVNIIPLFTMVVDFNWFQKLISLIVPGLGGVFGLFIIRSFFLGIPKELIEAAEVDGLNKFGIYLKIVLPLGKSALMVAGLFAFLGSWNDYLWPTLALAGTTVDWYTLPIGLSLLQGNNNYLIGLTMAGSVMSIIPVVIVYCFTQDKIIEGVSRTGIK